MVSPPKKAPAKRDAETRRTSMSSVFFFPSRHEGNQSFLGFATPPSYALWAVDSNGLSTPPPPQRSIN